MKTFAHTGDLGDIIYALPTIKALGGGELFLFPAANTREPMTMGRAYNIGNLLMRQDYIRRWTWGESHDQTYDYDFREWRKSYGGYENLAYSQAKHFGVGPNVADVPWLQVEPTPIAKVIVCRSHRYRQHDFPWPDLGQRYGKEAVVLGMKTEVEELAYGYGFVNCCGTPSLLEMAQVIAGAELVITNQTCAYAIAEGLKKPVLLERWTGCPNVDFDRPDVYTGMRVLEYLWTHPPETLTCAPTAAPRITGTRKPEPVPA